MHDVLYLLNLAERLARERHSGQVDKAGAEYWTHPQRVSQGCTSVQGKIAGWLHDLIEDTATTSSELLQLGFPEVVVNAVLLDTRQDGVPYMTYIGRIVEACQSDNPTVAAAGRIAREVKMSDLRDNMDLTRLSTVTGADLERVRKYSKAYAVLEATLS